VHEQRDRLATVVRELEIRHATRVIDVRRSVTGGNSGTFTVFYEDKKQVLKIFFGSTRDKYSRFRREVAFLRWAESRSIPYTPRLVSHSLRGCWVLLTHLPGSPVEQPVTWHFEACGNFISSLSRGSKIDMFGTPWARDALRKPADLARNVLSREIAIRARLSKSMPGVGLDRFLNFPIGKYLTSSLGADSIALAGFMRSVNLNWSDPILVSPSDFGFHNSLQVVAEECREMWFFDFEYGGKDHALKLIMDFLCQPNFLLEMEKLGAFLSRIQQYFPLKLGEIPPGVWRLFATKWVFIVANKEIDSFLQNGEASAQVGISKRYYHRFKEFFHVESW